MQRSVSGEMNPIMQNTMLEMCGHQLRQIVPQIQITVDDIQQYVVVRSSEDVAMSSDSSFESAVDSAEDTTQDVSRYCCQG